MFTDKNKPIFCKLPMLQYSVQESYPEEFVNARKS